MFRTVALVLVVASVMFSSNAEGKGAVDKFRSYDEHGRGRKQWLSSYHVAKDNCTWQQDVETLAYHYDWFATDSGMRSSYWGYLVSQMLITTYYPEFPSWFVRFLHFVFGPAPHGPALKSYSCRITQADGTEFRMRRLGPFLSNGGFDWHKMKLQDPYNLRPQAHQGSTIRVTGFMAIPVSDSGEILGNPPIHIHHANLGPNRNRSSLTRLSQWHGDSQCSESAGGTACYVTALPPGFGFPVSDALRLDVDFNDMRPLQSPDLEFWLETSISIAAPHTKIQDVGTVILGVPFTMRWWRTSDFQRLYYIPSQEPSALWVTGRMPTSGTFVPGGKLEIHQYMLDEAWVFTGVTPEDLGLNLEVWQLQKPWLPWVPSENGLVNSSKAMTALKARVVQHFQQAAKRCKEDSACKTLPTRMWTLNRTTFEDGEERQMPWPAKTWSFEQGDQFTTVIFHKVAPMSGHNHATEMAQHLAITGYYIPEADAKADYFFVLPSTNADWAWLNSVNWFVALTHFGGAPDRFWSWPLIVLVFIVVSCVVGCIVKIGVANMLNVYHKQLVDFLAPSGSSLHRKHKYAAVCPQQDVNYNAHNSADALPQVLGHKPCPEELA